MCLIEDSTLRQLRHLGEHPVEARIPGITSRITPAMQQQQQQVESSVNPHIGIVLRSNLRHGRRARSDD